MAKNRVNFLGLKYIDKIIVIVILRISLWMVVMLVTPFMVFANSTDRIGTNRNDRITASSSETIVNSSEVDKNEKGWERTHNDFCTQCILKGDRLRHLS